MCMLFKNIEVNVNKEWEQFKVFASRELGRGEEVREGAGGPGWWWWGAGGRKEMGDQQTNDFIIDF